MVTFDNLSRISGNYRHIHDLNMNGLPSYSYHKKNISLTFNGYTQNNDGCSLLLGMLCLRQ